MKRFGFIGLTVMMMMVIAPVSVFADSQADAIAVFKESSAVMPFFETAYGYAVFPTVGKGGLFCWHLLTAKGKYIGPAQPPAQRR